MSHRIPPGAFLVLGLALAFSTDVFASGSSTTCSPATPIAIPDNDPSGITDPIDVPDSVLLTDVQVSVQITHTFQGDLIVSVISPGGTGVTLHDQGGSGANDIVVTYSDSGVPNGSAPYDCACDQQPSGPGAMADFVGEDSQGIWALTVSDNLGADTGTLDDWCVITSGDPALPEFVRGDASGNGSFNGIVDASHVLNFQFVPGSPTPGCLEAADANNDGVVNGLTDGVFMLNVQFVPGSPPMPAPFPACGPDDDQALGCVNPVCP